VQRNVAQSEVGVPELDLLKSFVTLFNL
jgi:hypothetical protein